MVRALVRLDTGKIAGFDVRATDRPAIRTVTRNGTIKDPFVVEDQCTSSLYHRASINASLKFKYKPRVIDGQAVEVPGVQNKFTYEITE